MNTTIKTPKFPVEENTVTVATVSYVKPTGNTMTAVMQSDQSLSSKNIIKDALAGRGEAGSIAEKMNRFLNMIPKDCAFSIHIQNDKEQYQEQFKNRNELSKSVKTVSHDTMECIC